MTFSLPCFVKLLLQSHLRRRIVCLLWRRILLLRWRHVVLLKLRRRERRRRAQVRGARVGRLLLRHERGRVRVGTGRKLRSRIAVGVSWLRCGTAAGP